MEQYQTIEPSEREPVSVKLQAWSLILGIIGLVVSFIGFFSILFSSASAFAAEFDTEIMPAAGTVTIVLLSAGILIGAIAAVLGIVGLVRSIRRPRTVKGIVLSALGLDLGISAVALAVYAFLTYGLFSNFVQNFHSFFPMVQ